MQDKVESKTQHEVHLIMDDKMTMTAVKSVPSFDNSEIMVTLADSKLKIEGERLEIDKLDLENETLAITGKVTSLVYGKGDMGKSLIKRIFK